MTRKKRKQLRKANRNIHHRKPISTHGKNSDTIHVPIVKHELWHEMFGNMTPEMIAVRISNVWLPSNYEIIIRRKDADRLVS